jgi:hypothetical protein
MDISYVLAARPSDTENWSTITEARVVEHAVAGYIAQLPNAQIPANRAALQGRITVSPENESGYLPIRAVAESEGATVEWNAQTREITVTTAAGETYVISYFQITNGRAYVPPAIVSGIFVR